MIPEVLAGNDQPEDETFAAIMERFKYVEPENKASCIWLMIPYDVPFRRSQSRIKLTTQN